MPSILNLDNGVGYFLINIVLLGLVYLDIKRALNQSIKNKKTGYFGFDIAFHHEANFHKESGRMTVVHKNRNLTCVSIPFSIKGIDTLPRMTPDLLTYIVGKAADEGYIFQWLDSYGTLKNESPKVPGASFQEYISPLASAAYRETFPNIEETPPQGAIEPAVMRTRQTASRLNVELQID